jgi:hypothetical protein
MSYEYPSSDMWVLRFKMWATIIVLSFTIIKSIYCIIRSTEHSVNMGWLIFCVISLLCAIYLASDRNTYLAFLGRAVYPCGDLPTKTPEGANTRVEVRVPPNSNVIFWASDKAANSDSNMSAIVDNPWDAYKNYSNAGVANADANGTAILNFRAPIGYMVNMSGFNKELKPHVHYRYCIHPGMLSPVYTKSV